MILLPRSVSLAMFRAHIENGLTVAAGVSLAALVFGLLGFDAAIAAGTGALCVSICDRNDPLDQKPWIMGTAFLFACLFTAITALATFSLPAIIAVTALTGLWAGLISAYGRWVLALAMTCVLSFVFVIGERFVAATDATAYVLLFVCGALAYAIWSLLVARVLDDRVRRLLLGEAMRAFAGYLRAKAALYNPDTAGQASFRALIDAHSVLAGHLQAARDTVLFARRNYPLQQRRIAILAAILDAFETTLSSDTDTEYLRRAPHHDQKWRDLMWQLNHFVHAMAGEVDALTLTLRRRSHRHDRQAQARIHDRRARALRESVDAALAANPADRTLQAILSSANKLILADRYLADLGRALDRDTPPRIPAAGLDLELFRAHTPHGLAVLLHQFTLASPALRYGLRLALAMTTGLLLTLVFPRFAHASWILLTIALIMRANYSVTRRRRWDRVTGTLIGCALAALFIAGLPDPVLLLIIALAVGINHAYGPVQYRITAIGASVLSLLLLHFLDPLENPLFIERVVDTLIGAGLSWVFSYLLPSWERESLPRTVQGLLTADAAFAQAALRLDHVESDYRLARKKALDAVAGLSGAIRRLGDEPRTSRRAMAWLGALAGAHYLLASDLVSMPVLVKLRAQTLDTALAGRAIAQTRARVVRLLDPSLAEDGGGENEAPISLDPHGSGAMSVLARRLEHIEQGARRVAHLAARPAIEHL